MKRATTIVFIALGIFFSGGLLAQPGKPVPVSPASGSVKVALTENFIWNNAFTVDSFRLQIATDSLFTSPVLDTTQGPSILYKTRAGLLANYTTYYWRVYGIDAIGAGPWSDIQNFRTIDALPAAPTLTKPANNSKNAPFFADFMWNAVARASRYQLQISAGAGFNPNELDTVVGSGVRTVTYDRDTLKKDSTYFWRVRTENEAGWGNWSGNFTFNPTFFSPTVPVLLSPANSAVNQPLNMSLDWADSKHATKYRIYIGTNPQLTTIVYRDSSLMTSVYKLPVDNLLLDSSTTYYWTVAAGDDDDFYSQYSDTFMFTTINMLPPSRPTNLTPKTATVQATRRPTFTWTENSTYPADSFHLHISTFFTFTDTAVLAVTTAQSYAVPASNPLPHDTVLFWRVAGKNAGGFSPWSFFWNITTAVNNPVATFAANLYPNPATTATTLEFELKQTRAVRIAVTDINGREVMEVYSGQLNAGSQSVTLNLASLPAGTYFAVIGSADGMQAVPFVKQ